MRCGGTKWIVPTSIVVLMIRYLFHIALGMWLFIATVGAPTIHHWCSVPVPVADCGCPVEEHNPCCELQITFESVDLPAVLPHLVIVSPSQLGCSISVVPLLLSPCHSNQPCSVNIEKFVLFSPFAPTQTTHLLI